MGLKAYAQIAAAEGAVAAYRDIIGEDRKPFVPAADNTLVVDRKAASAEFSASGG